MLLIYQSDYQSTAQYCLSGLFALEEVLDAEDQRYLRSVALRTFDICRRRGDHWGVYFWMVNPLVEMELIS